VNAETGNVSANYTATFGNYQGIQYDFALKQIYTATLNTEFYWEVGVMLETGNVKSLLTLPNTPTSVISTAYSQTNHTIYLFSESLSPYGRMQLQGVNTQTKAVSTNVQTFNATFGLMFYLDATSTLYAWNFNAQQGTSSLVTINISTGNYSAPIVTLPGIAFQSAQAYSYSSGTLYSVLKQPVPQNPLLVGVNLASGKVILQINTDWNIAGFAVVGSTPTN